MLIYFLVSSILSCGWAYYEINYGKDKERLEEEIGDITWSTGAPRESVRFTLYAFVFLLGGLLLPLMMICHVLDSLGKIK